MYYIFILFYFTARFFFDPLVQKNLAPCQTNMGVFGKPSPEMKRDFVLLLLLWLVNKITISTLVAGIVYWAGAGVKGAVGSFVVLTYLHVYFGWMPFENNTIFS